MRGMLSASHCRSMGRNSSATVSSSGLSGSSMPCEPITEGSIARGAAGVLASARNASLATGASTANDLLHRFYTDEFPRPRIASFSKLVDQAATEGDGIAQEILQQAARQLAIYTAAVRRRLFQEGEAVAVAYIGGVFRSDLLRERFRTLVELEEGCRVGPPVFGPAAGALLEAYRMAGRTVKLQNVPEQEK